MISGFAQQYAWGKPRDISRVFSLAQDNLPKVFNQSNSTPQDVYAELWFGTHPSGPTRVLGGPEQISSLALTESEGYQSLNTLSQHINTTTDASSPSHVATLPYLFKVLSINEALSLQSHPDKALAETLFKNFPQHYKDDNHKPELVLALTPLRVMCGFRTLASIRANLAHLNDISNGVLVPHSLQQQLDAIDLSRDNQLAQQALLKLIWSHLYTLSDEQCAALITAFQHKYHAQKNAYVEQITSNTLPDWNNFDESIAALIWELSKTYPSDIAVFAPVFLHYFALQPGQSIFLGPNIPHAYLYGDCAEIMACSDNVIRAGLTPKYRDVDTLLTSLTYDTNDQPLINNGVTLPLLSPPSPQVVTSLFGDNNSPIVDNVGNVVHHRVYQPPLAQFPEFMIVETSIQQDNVAAQLPTLSSGSILLLQQGAAKIAILGSSDDKQQPPPSSVFSLQRGNALYIPPAAQVFVQSLNTPVIIHRSAANQQF